MKNIIAKLGLLSAVLFPITAHAAGSDISAMFVGVIDAVAPVWISVGILVGVIAGLTLMLSRDEGAMEKAKNTLAAVAIGGIIGTVFLTLGATDAISIVYNGIPGTMFLNTADRASLEVAGIADWVATISVIVGVLIIIVAATRAVLSFGDEGSYTNIRYSVLHIVVGLIIIGGAYVFQSVLFAEREPTGLLNLFLGPLLVILGMIGLIAVAILIYAGFRMIISFGREDEFTAARSLAFRVVIGIVVLLLSFTLIAIVTSIF